MSRGSGFGNRKHCSKKRGWHYQRWKWSWPGTERRCHCIAADQIKLKSGGQRDRILRKKLGGATLRLFELIASQLLREAIAKFGGAFIPLRGGEIVPFIGFEQITIGANRILETDGEPDLGLLKTLIGGFA